MRVISGSAKGRKLFPVPGDTTRPITDRVKESLFDILAGDVTGSVWLDLFAGTGGVGIEALSRGARKVVFIDKVRKAVDVLRRNLTMTGLAEGAEVRCADAFHYLQQAPAAAFDYIYIAPPQYADLWSKALLAVDARGLLAPEGLAIVQIYPKEFHPLTLTHLKQADERRYGSTLLAFFSPDQPLSEEAPADDSAL